MSDTKKVQRNADEALAAYVQNWFDAKQNSWSGLDPIDEAILDAIEAVSHGRCLDGDLEDQNERVIAKRWGEMAETPVYTFGSVLADRAGTYSELTPTEVVQLLAERGFAVDTHGISVG